MTLYLLRHEKRFEEPLFFTELTPDGKKDSFKLINKINEINPDVIISSPFLRCLQTIYPYLLHSKKKVDIEYSLYEYLHEPIFTYQNFNHKVEELFYNYPHFKQCINSNYKSFLNFKNIKYPEKSHNQLNKRLIPFIDNLIKKYKNSDFKILIVSHMSIISCIKHYINTGNYLDKEVFFEMGQIEKFIF